MWSLLFLSLALSALLLLTLGSSDISGLHELQYGAFLLLGVLELHRLPHFVNFTLAGAFCLLFHVGLLDSRLFLQVMLLEGVVLFAHHLSLAPLLQTGSVVLGLVPPQEVLKTTDVLKAEVVEAKFKIDETMVLVKTVDEHAPNALIELVVADVQTEQGRVLAECVDHLLDTAVLLTVMGQVVRLHVEGA